MTPAAEIATLDQQITFCRRELLELAKVASEQHNAIVAYIHSHQEEHSGEEHACELCEVARKLQQRIKQRVQ